MEYSEGNIEGIFVLMANLVLLMLHMRKMICK
jgi:hypothetical protein